MTASVVIDSPLLQVFDYVANAENQKEWVPLYSDVKALEVKEEGCATKGDTFLATLSLLPEVFQRLLPDGSVWRTLSSPQIKIELDDVVHGRRLSYRADIGWTTICDFEASGDRTIFTATQSVWSVPGLVSSFWLGPLQVFANDMQRRILEGLKRRLEGRAIEPRPQIFFSYRRSDARYVGGRIFDALTAEFGAGTVFRDTNSLLPGADWSDNIREAIEDSRVVVVHIGDKWETHLARMAGRPDGLRDELRAALKKGAGSRVIPVLTSKRNRVNLYERMGEIEAALRSLTDGRDAYIREKFTRRVQLLHLREDPDFKGDLERLIRAVWTEFRRAPSEAEARIEPVGVQVSPAADKALKRAAGDGKAMARPLRRRESLSR